jgi:hypothetical protein
MPAQSKSSVQQANPHKILENAFQRPMRTTRYRNQSNGKTDASALPMVFKFTCKGKKKQKIQLSNKASLVAMRMCSVETVLDFNWQLTYPFDNIQIFLES